MKIASNSYAVVRIQAWPLRLAVILGCWMTAFLCRGAEPFPDSIKTFLSLIERYDIRESVAAIDSGALPEVFWERVSAGSPELSSLREAVARRDPATMAGIKRLHGLHRYSPSRSIARIDLLQSWIDSLAQRMLGISSHARAVVLRHPWATATIAEGDGGITYLLVNDGLLERCESFGADTASLMLEAAMARAYAHGVMAHHLREFVARERKLDRFALWSAIAGLVSGRVSREIMRQYDREEYIDDLRMLYPDRQYLENIEAESAAYYFPFSDELEIEADIVAYRFMEWRGHGDAYIASVAMLDDPLLPPLVFTNDNQSESTRFRIALLKFMRDNPDLDAYRKRRLKETRLDDPIY
ncbi:MAG: hypothetical protein NC336_04540 [Clostridium sp.]|nr:hypothetical protein [Clostridium sp.]